MAEVDGNRTRRRGVTTTTRFEGGGAHQVPGHLQDQATLAAVGYLMVMKKLLLLAALLGLTLFAVRKLKEG